jgi:DNA-binding protein HU-beta
MRKAEIIRRIAEETDLTQTQIEKAVNAILQEIKTALQHDDTVILRGFGSFRVRDKAARIGRNPTTGQEATISPRRVVLFKSGQPLRDAVNGSPAEATHLQR